MTTYRKVTITQNRFDELRNAERIFSLVRMRNAVVTDEAFELP